MTPKVPRARLDSDRIHSDLSQEVRNGVILQVLESVGSTNDVVAAHVSENPDALLVVCTADEQTAGRGRLDRSWTSPFGAGVAISLAFPAEAIGHSATLIPLHFGWLVIQALQECGAVAKLKWPNDIVAATDDQDVRKLGGILSSKIGDSVIVGIGINFSLEEDELPTDMATSLALEGYSLSREVFIARLIALTWETLTSGSVPDAWLEEYKSACSTIGREITVHQADGTHYSARATGIDDQGGLVIAREGQLSVITVGDIVHLR